MRKFPENFSASKKRGYILAVISAAVLCIAIAASAIIPALADRKASPDSPNTPTTTAQAAAVTHPTKPA